LQLIVSGSLFKARIHQRNNTERLHLLYEETESQKVNTAHRGVTEHFSNTAYCVGYKHKEFDYCCQASLFGD